MTEQRTDIPSKRRRLHWHFGIWMLVLVLFGSLFLLVASMSLTGRVLVMPGWATERVETRVNDAMASGSISLGRVEIGVTPRGRPRLRLVDIGVRDGTGLEIAQLNGVEGGLKPLALLRGTLEPTTLYLSGAQVTLRRRANGEFDLSFGQGGGASGDLAGVLDAIDKVFTDGPLARVENIQADALTITLEDARSGRLWQVTDGRMKLTSTKDVVDITVAFDVFNQTEELAQTVLGFRSAKGSSEASFGATFKNAAAADIAAQSPVLSFLSVVDAPISGALRTSIDAQGTLTGLAGTLELGDGALSPAPGARPVRFGGAKVYIDFDPAQQRVNFSEISVQSELGLVRGEGHAYLRDFNRGWPSSLLGQVKLNGAQVNPRGMFEDPVVIDGGAADFRLRLNPFTLDLGQVVLLHGDNSYTASGQVTAGRDGWGVSLDGATDLITKDEILSLWPVSLADKPRAWVASSVMAGEVFGARAAFRLEPGQEMRVSAGAGFRGASARVVPLMPLVENASGYMSIEGQTFTVVTEAGNVTAPSGDVVDVAGTVYHVPHMPTKPTPAWVDLHLSGPVGGALSVLAGKPFEIFKFSDLGPDLASGTFRAEGRLDLILKQPMDPLDTRYDISADVTGIRSDVLIKDHILTASAARVHATNEMVEVTGDGRIGAVGAGGTWRQLMGEDHRGRSRLEGWLELSARTVEEFNIGLPDETFSGRGVGRMTVDLAQGEETAFSLESDLNRVGIRIPSLSWSKPANQTGRFMAQGALGDVPRVDVLEFEAPGLKASGQLSVNPDGGLDQAAFSRVQLGGWLDAPVTFVGRGVGKDPGIRVSGGSVDMRRAEFASGAGGSDAPVQLTLDRMTISQGIVLTGFSGDFNRSGGLNGTFSSLVDGGAAIKGTLAPQPDGSAVRITSADAGGVLRAAGVFQSAQGGALELILAPRKGEGIYEGQLKVSDTRVANAPSLAGLLSAVSVIGILEQLDGQGLSFPEVDARFRLTPNQVTVYQSSAVGPSLGLSMDGTYDLGTSSMDMQGVISPFYMVNAIGQIFTRKGEGLVGFNFTLKGTPDDPVIGVNPLSIFTPGMFRDIFRRPPPKPEE